MLIASLKGQMQNLVFLSELMMLLCLPLLCLPLLCLPIATAFAQPLAQPSAQQRNSKAAELLAYDRSVAFDLKEASTKEQEGAVVSDLNYAAYAPRHGRIKAYLVKPKGAGPFAGVLFFHWLGRPKGDRSQFLDEAVTLAKQGAVSLLIQGYFPWSEPPTDARSDRQRIIDQTIEVRRALDVLLSQKEVDPRRVAYVGHDYGAMYGGIVAGVERRAKTYVLMAAPGNFSDWSLKYWPATAAAGRDIYQQSVEELDPIRYVSRARPASLLFQFANVDEFIPKAVAKAFFDQASEPRQVKWYDADHALNIEAARNDRHEWLTRQLGLPKS